MMNARDVDTLPEHLCVRLGFCLASSSRDAIRSQWPTDAHAFTDAVFRAEGLDPPTADRHLYRQVLNATRNAFARAQDNRITSRIPIELHADTGQQRHGQGTERASGSLPTSVAHVLLLSSAGATVWIPGADCPAEQVLALQPWEVAR